MPLAHRAIAKPEYSQLKDLRKTLDEIWWVLRTGSPWNQLPERCGKWNSVYRQHLRWSHGGLWPKLLAAIVEERADTSILPIDAAHFKAHQDACRHPSSPEKQALGKTKGGRKTKLNASVDAAGKLVALLLVPGNEHEVKSAADLLGNDPKGAVVLADKGYQSSELAAHILDLGGFPKYPVEGGDKRTAALR